MNVIAHVAELAGGLGAILIGTWLATSGLGFALGRRLGGGAPGSAQGQLATFGRGLAISSLLGANGSLPAGAASLARRAGMGVERTTLLVLGSSFGAAAMAALVVLANLGWAVPTLALAVLAAAAATHSIRSRWTPWGEASAGLALVFVGIGLLQRGWIGVGPLLHLPTVDQRPYWIVPLVVAGALLGCGLRSPGAAAAFFVQGAAVWAFDGLSAAACLLGVLASLCWTSIAHLRSGTAEERSMAALHLVFALTAALVGGLVFAWGFRLPSMLARTPAGPAMWLTLLLVLALGAASGLVTLLRRQIHWLLAGRFAPRLGRSILARDLRAGCESIPALALGGLAGACDAAASVARDLARKELSGTGTTDLRRRQAREAATRHLEEIEGFRLGLEGVRWPGEAIEAVLQAARGARAWRELIDELLELCEHPIPSSDEATKRRYVRLRFGALYRIEGVDADGQPVSAADLEQEREVFETELRVLRRELVTTCTEGRLTLGELEEHERHLELLSKLVRTACQAVAARERLEGVSFRYLPELPEEAQPLREPEEITSAQHLLTTEPAEQDEPLEFDLSTEDETQARRARHPLRSVPLVAGRGKRA